MSDYVVPTTPTAPSNPSPTPEAPKSPIPEKFGGSVEKLSQAYSALEKRFTELQTAAKNAPKTETEAPKTYNMADIEQRFYANNGELGAEDRLALNKMGFSDRFIDGYSKVFQSEVANLKTKLGEVSDGVNPDDVVKFVNERIGKDYTEKFVDGVNEAIANGKFGLWRDLVADYKAAHAPKEGKPYSQGNASRGDGFQSAKDIQKAFLGVRSGKETYDGIQRRLANTAPDIVNQFNSGGF